MYALSPVKPMNLTPGTRVGSWIVEAELGRGAMATVYRVVHETLGTNAALKVLDRADPDHEARLLAEGRAQAAIRHPGVLAVLDVLATGDGQPALLMELVEGVDLGTLLARERLEQSVALELFRQILDAVEAAHARDLVHRDLKPGNVLVAEIDGRWVAKVADFGLVKSPGSDATATRALLGTPRYMAPEQMRSARRIDASADVFALGCILYELLVVQPAFPGDDLVDLYTAKSASAYGDLAVLAPELPDAVVRAVHGALSGSTSRRIPSCATLRAVLDGAPWPPSGVADQTLDDAALGAWRCPGCGTSTELDVCGACGANTLLSGRYQLVDALAESRWTRTWRALDLTEGRWVVCRALSREAPADIAARFRRGVEVLAALDHPQLPQIVEPCFEEADRSWEIRELVDGESLSTALKDTRFSEREVLDLLLDLVPVLAYLHERRPPVLHRNLTLDNVLRASDGRLVLIDFANARDTSSDPQLGGATFEGTFGAMAPEQYRGDASPATDVYGLGTLAVALLSRRPLASLQTVDGLAWREAVEVSPETEALLADLLATEPGSRPEVRAVGRRIAERSSPAPLVSADAERLAVTVSRQRRWLAGGVVVAGLGAMGLAGTMVLGAAAETVRANSVYRAVEGLAIKMTLAPTAQAADLADRPVPTANCDERPAVATVEVLGSESAQIRYRRACSGASTWIGELEPGVHEIPLPASGRLYAVGASASWQCPSGEPSTSGCGFDADGTGATVSFEPYGSRTMRLVDDQGAALAGAIAWSDRVGVRMIADDQGVISFPCGSRCDRYTEPMDHLGWRVEVDGVARTLSGISGGDTVVALAEGDLYEGRLVDHEGRPIAGADVHWLVGDVDLGRLASRAARDGTMEILEAVSRTDDDGRFAVHVPAGPARQHQISVEHDGFKLHHVAAVGPSTVGPELVLGERRLVRVGCAGLEEDRCTTRRSASMVDCVGDRWIERVGLRTCRKATALDGTEELRCACLTDDVAISSSRQSVELTASDALWLDFRDIPGGVRGRIPSADLLQEGCDIEAYDGSAVRLRTRPDADGRFQLDGMHAGYWDVSVSCGDWSHDLLQRVDRDVISLELTALD